MAQRTYKTFKMTEKDFEDEDEEVFHQKLGALLKTSTRKIKDLWKGCDTPLKKGALIFGLVVLILCVILGAISLITYITHGELIHIPWGNKGHGFHWPNNNN